MSCKRRLYTISSVLYNSLDLSVSLQQLPGLSALLKTVVLMQSAQALWPWKPGDQTDWERRATCWSGSLVSLHHIDWLTWLHLVKFWVASDRFQSSVQFCLTITLLCISRSQLTTDVNEWLIFQRLASRGLTEFMTASACSPLLYWQL